MNRAGERPASSERNQILLPFMARTVQAGGVLANCRGCAECLTPHKFLRYGCEMFAIDFQNSLSSAG